VKIKNLLRNSPLSVVTTVLLTFVSLFPYFAFCQPTDLADVAASSFKYKITITEKTVANALLELQAQTKTQFLYQSDIEQGFDVIPFSGSFTLRDALKRLLNQSDLTFKQIEQSLFVITKRKHQREVLSAQPIEKPISEISRLPDVVVVGETYFHLCCDGAPSTAVKSYTPSFEVPKSLEGIDASTFRNRGNATLMETFRDFSSVRITDQSGQLNLRGFKVQDSSLLKSGLPSISRGITPIPLQNIDGIEIVKGASSALYGFGQPGGVINLIAKKPKPTSFTQVGASYGNYDHYFSLDSNNNFFRNETLMERINILFREESDYHEVEGKLKQIQIAPTITAFTSPNSELSLYLEYNLQEMQGFRGPRAYDQVTPGSDSELALSILYPDLQEVPYYPFTSSQGNDYHRSESFDLWTTFDSSLQADWDYRLSTFVGRSNIEANAFNDLTIWYMPLFDTKTPFYVSALLDAPAVSEFQSNFIEVLEDFKNRFNGAYSGIIDTSGGLVESIYNSVTPVWSESDIRFYEQFNYIPTESRHAGVELVLNHGGEWVNFWHNLTLGTTYVKSEIEMASYFFYNKELYDLGSQYLNSGQSGLGFALRRLSQYSWYY